MKLTPAQKKFLIDIYKKAGKGMPSVDGYKPAIYLESIGLIAMERNGYWVATLLGVETVEEMS